MHKMLLFTSDRLIGAIKYFAPEMMVDKRWHWCDRFDADSANKLKLWLDGNGYKPKRIRKDYWEEKDTLQKLGWLIDGLSINSHVDADGSLFLYPSPIALEK